MICGRESRWPAKPASAVLDGSALEYALACDTASLDAAFRLTHDQYVRQGYMSPHPSGRRLSLYHALPTTKVFVVRLGGRVVGTISLIEDSPLGLPMEELYGAEVARLREQRRRVSEVSALAMDADSQRHGTLAVLGLIRMAELYAAEAAWLDDTCISVNPRHVGFYRKFLGFEPIGPRRSYHRVNGAPAEALRLDLGEIRRLIRALHAGAPATKRNQFMFGEDRYQHVMASVYRDLERSVLSPEQFVHFFADHEAFSAAPEPHRSHVLSVYADRSPQTERVPARSPWMMLSASGLASAT
jgi:hypothetical protein